MLSLMQAMLEDVPIGLLLVDVTGAPLWFNNEAVHVCAVWKHGEAAAAALRADKKSITLPAPVWASCQTVLDAWSRGNPAHPVTNLTDHERGLHAHIHLQIFPTERGKRAPKPAFYIRLDYRRPRGDRNRPLSADSVTLLARLSHQEREVAMRLREGLSTAEIAVELRRSPLTVKTHMSSIYRKLGVGSGKRVAALLNR
ncbi:response regulator transcription factor [Oleiharenicola lentus]|uniref:helix-turn-helix transcriptional regulator n=1 Tax=Oleiharenicola lentus TaxID=2508720 RepID=UPI003F6618FC